MKLTDLLGCDVVTTTGRHVGKVHDALLVQDGPPASEMHASFRLHALAVGRRSIGTRLGFAHGHVTSPTVLRLLFGETLGLLPWEAIIERNNKRLVIDDNLNLDAITAASHH